MTPDPSGFFHILEVTLSSQPGRVDVFTFSLPDLFNNSGNDCNSTIITTPEAFSRWLLLLTLLRFVFFLPAVVDLSSTGNNRVSDFALFLGFSENKTITCHARSNRNY